MSQKKILIVEDDRRIAQNISRGLQDEGYLTEVVYEGLNGRQAAIQPDVDLLILDLNLPGLSGFEVCRSVRTERPKLPIIILSALGEIEDKVEGLTLGADDYLVKPFDFRELIARVATCFRRLALSTNTGAESEEVWQIANLTVNVTTKEVRRGNVIIDLTAREFALLEFMIRNKGRVLPKADIAETVWSLNFDPGTNVVEVYINYLRRKIDRDFEPKLIHTRPGMGYVLKEEKE
ncbi:response regulator transcription factor [Spirosoma sp. SC4-14]|uniref:response regulator transcription factor n=1 Tax=Spirosoma sp. SC4-14 TaxID=3128900 RepID=UPI0030CB5AA8